MLQMDLEAPLSNFHGNWGGEEKLIWTFPPRAEPGLLFDNFDEDSISRIHHRCGLFLFGINRLDTFVS